VAIARALVNEPAVIFADEPTGSLDERNAQLVEDLLLNLVAERKVALMLITHNNVFAEVSLSLIFFLTKTGPRSWKKPRARTCFCSLPAKS
ncbi:hypothetical protein Q6282_27770, partial [Klebsiella pneumoniae]|nr:hypothetical protein [Klebsiella pneumoniae]